MWDKFRKLNEEGILFPYAKNSVNNQPSVTLFFLYINNILAFMSLIYLHIKGDIFIATATTCVYSIIWAVLYLMKSIKTFKADLDDQSIELEGEDEEADPKHTSDI